MTMIQKQKTAQSSIFILHPEQTLHPRRSSFLTAILNADRRGRQANENHDEIYQLAARYHNVSMCRYISSMSFVFFVGSISITLTKNHLFLNLWEAEPVEDLIHLLNLDL